MPQVQHVCSINCLVNQNTIYLFKNFSVIKQQKYKCTYIFVIINYDTEYVQSIKTPGLILKDKIVVQK